MLIDLHAHCRPFSWDSDVGADDLIVRAKAAGLDGVCFTDHDYVWRPDHVAALARRHAFLVLPGAEIDTDCGHVLCYGIERYLHGMHQFGVLEAAVHGAGGALVAAHPYRVHQKDRKDDEALDKAAKLDFFGRVDGLEGVNGRGSQRQNGFSTALAQRLGKATTGGSDSHRLDGIGVCATEFERDISSVDDLVRELRAGRCRPAIVAASVEV